LAFSSIFIHIHIHIHMYIISKNERALNNAYAMYIYIYIYVNIYTATHATSATHATHTTHATHEPLHEPPYHERSQPPHEPLPRTLSTSSAINLLNLLNLLYIFIYSTNEPLLTLMLLVGDCFAGVACGCCAIYCFFWGGGCVFSGRCAMRGFLFLVTARCVCVFVCARWCVCVCVYMCMRVCVCVCSDRRFLFIIFCGHT
jgi:hypothetical protein